MSGVGKVKRVGVLGLQGSVAEHAKMVEKCGAEVVNVKYPSDLDGIDGLVFPGGESTTLGKLLVKQGLMDPLRDKIDGGLPVYGTCAGMILLSKEISGDDTKHIGSMNIKVRRNAYGSQLDSFITNSRLQGITDREIPLVFIRAPWIEETYGDVDYWKVDGRVVAARERNMFVTSFHPELTEDDTIHRYFIENMIK